MVELTAKSGCKINLLLNVLGRRPDGFHELETVMLPVPIYDELQFEKTGDGIHLTCNKPELSVGEDNLIVRAAQKFFERVPGGVRVHLTKNLPIGGGIGAGSANAAVTLKALNEMNGFPLSEILLHQLAADLGSDVPFFLNNLPALATGRGEQVTNFVANTRGWTLVLVFPGFGVSTPWAYKELKNYPGRVSGKEGLAEEMKACLEKGEMESVCNKLFNSLEAPVSGKYPILQLYQDFFRELGAVGTLMSGSGSTTFAWFREQAIAQSALEGFRDRFGAQITLFQTALET